MNRLMSFSWILLLAAVAAFAGLVYQVGALEMQAAAKASAASSAAQAVDQSAYVQRVHAVAVDTAARREALEKFARIDIVSTVQDLEAAGKSAGVNVTVTGATPEGGGIELPGGNTLQWISFTLTADGSYAALTRAEMVYEKLPFASQIQQIDLDQTAGAASKGAWHMTLRIRILAIPNTL